MCEAAVAWALYLQTVASFGRMTGNPYLADLGRFADHPGVIAPTLGLDRGSG
jgi:hypothetical protein